MSETFQFDVFLSYSHADRKAVEQLAQALKEAGLRVWQDHTQIKPGESIPARLLEGLESSRVVVLCVSESSMSSDWSAMEVLARLFDDPLNRARRFIPMRLGGARLRGPLAQFSALDWTADGRETCLAALVQACSSAEKPDGAAQNAVAAEGKGCDSGGSLDDYPLAVRGLLGRALRSECEGEVWRAARGFGEAAAVLEASGAGTQQQIESIKARQRVNEELAAQLRLEYRGQTGPTLVKVFDENNQFLRTATKLEVHRDGLQHHTALLVARAGSGEVIYYQRRPEQTYAGAYDFLGGHTADIDKTPLDTALREANEELRLDVNCTRLPVPEAWLHQVGPDHHFEWHTPQDRERSTLFVVALPDHPALHVRLTDEAADGVELIHVPNYLTSRLADLAADFRSGRKDFAPGAERILIAYESDPEIRAELDRWFC